MRAHFQPVVKYFERMRCESNCLDTAADMTFKNILPGAQTGVDRGALGVALVGGYSAFMLHPSREVRARAKDRSPLPTFVVPGLPQDLATNGVLKASRGSRP
jgi:hypothetical protein